MTINDLSFYATEDDEAKMSARVDGDAEEPLYSIRVKRLRILGIHPLNKVLPLKVRD